MRTFRFLLVLAGLGLIGFAAYGIHDRVTFSREAWKADFAQLLDHTSKVYANLEWAQQKGVDLPKLRRDTLEALDRAESNAEAREAIRAFTRAFGDGHFVVHRVKLSKRLERWWRSLRAPASSEETPLTAQTPADVACARLGFGPSTEAPRFDVTAHGGELVAAEHPADAQFPAGTVPLAGGAKLGLLRIGTFGLERYGASCQEAWAAFRTTLQGTCHEVCQEEFVYTKVPTALLKALERRIDQLEQRGVTGLAVDVTGNGGGTDWVEAAARVFSPREVSGIRIQAIRHPHWQTRSAELLKELETALQTPGLAEGDRVLLAEAIARQRAFHAEVSAPCDRSGLWEGKPVACSGLTATPRYSTGVLPRVPAGALAKLEIRTALDKTLAYDFTPGRFRGPLYVLIDGGTGSAAEAFAAVLADTGGATLLGTRTVGAGCGYTNGGVPAKLTHSGLEVRMPDCVRLRADGTNEVDGIAPQLGVEWESDSAGRAEQLVAAVTSARAMKHPRHVDATTR